MSSKSSRTPRKRARRLESGELDQAQGGAAGATRASDTGLNFNTANAGADLFFSAHGDTSINDQPTSRSTRR